MRRGAADERTEAGVLHPRTPAGYFGQGEGKDVSISSEEELAAVIRGTTVPFRIKGGGTRDVGRPGAGEALDVSGIAGIRLYEPGALTLVAAAGTPLAEVEAVLAAEGQRLAFEPADWRGLLGTAGEPTLGGWSRPMFPDPAGFRRAPAATRFWACGSWTGPARW